jgi:hypothetical protein
MLKKVDNRLKVLNKALNKSGIATTKLKAQVQSISDYMRNLDRQVTIINGTCKAMFPAHDQKMKAVRVAQQNICDQLDALVKNKLDVKNEFASEGEQDADAKSSSSSSESMNDFMQVYVEQ